MLSDTHDGLIEDKDEENKEHEEKLTEEKKRR